MTSFAALGLAVIAVVGLLVHVWLFNLLIVVVETYLGKPRLKFLKSTIPGHGFAFGFNFNEEKEPGKYNQFKIRLFNPYGAPTQFEVAKFFDSETTSFAKDLDMGEGLIKLLGASNFENARVMVELASTTDGVNFQYEMKGSTFKKKLQAANQTVAEYVAKDSGLGKPPIDVPMRSFIADTVPGKGVQPAIESNPAFAHLFQGAGGDAGASAGSTAQFAVSKVWIDPGCIVCNACEDIYPEVFEVKADTCIIRPNAPLDDGLKIKEAAEACPVEVIKFNIA